MSLLIINTMDKNDNSVQQAISKLAEKHKSYRVINTQTMDIRHCIGCNHCWLKTPGICAIKDDYEEILKAYLEYDTILFICDTALGFIEHKAKNIFDRILPLVTMHICIADGQMRHVERYNKCYSFGLLYSGDADLEYMNRWFNRFSINIRGKSLGALPIDRSEEMKLCI